MRATTTQRLTAATIASPLAPHELKPDIASGSKGCTMTAANPIDHDRPYPADYLATILKEVKTIAMVGANAMASRAHAAPAAQCGGDDQNEQE